MSGAGPLGHDPGVALELRGIGQESAYSAQGELVVASAQEREQFRSRRRSPPLVVLRAFENLRVGFLFQSTPQNEEDEI